MELLEDRVTPSATSMDSLPASQPIAAALEQQAMQFIVTASVTVQNEASIIWQAITQEIAQVRAYVVLQLDQILGIAPNLQNPSLISPKPSAGNGSGNGSGATTITHIASNHQPSNSIPPAGDGSGSGSGSGATIKPLGAPGGPNIVGFGGYTWNPTVAGNLASDPRNWLLAEAPQGVDGTVPHAGTNVAFDPGDPNAKNGGAPITWDKNATFGSMFISGQLGQVYSGQQTINSGIRVEMTGGVAMVQTAGKLAVLFTDNGSVLQVDSNSSITNMALTSNTASQGQFNINGGSTTIAQSNYSERLGVQLNISPGATLTDQSEATLWLTANNTVINDRGTMYLINGGGNILIGNFAGQTGLYINVDGGSLSYAGAGGITDTFQVPVLVQNGGIFVVTSAPSKEAGAGLVINGTVPNEPNNASVYVTGFNVSMVELSQGATLDAVNNYYQDPFSILETEDNTNCNLDTGPNGSPGTVTIAGGDVKIDPQSINTQSYTFGKLQVVGSMNFSGYLDVSVLGYAFNNNEGTSRDQLYVSGGTLTLNAGSVLNVYAYGTLVQKDFWNVIFTPSNNIAGDFGTKHSIPQGLNTGQSHLNSPANLAEYVRETPRSSRRSTASPSSSVCL